MAGWNSPGVQHRWQRLHWRPFWRASRHVTLQSPGWTPKVLSS